MTDCTDDKCKVIKDGATKEYLLNMNNAQIKEVMHHTSLRKRFKIALNQCGLDVVEIYKVVEK